MIVRPMELPEVRLIEPRAFTDSRGYFFELFQAGSYEQHGIRTAFVQDNLSRSVRGVVRGLHFQLGRPQTKLIQVIRGAVFDVAVDVRRSSPTFGRWVSAILSDENHHQLLIPEGFAHGFCVLSDTADLLYKCSDYYAPQEERTLLWNDPDVNVAWPVQGEPILSPKDSAGTPLATLDAFA